MPITLRHDAAAVVPPSNQTTRKYGQQLVLQQQQQKYAAQQAGYDRMFDAYKQQGQQQFQLMRDANQNEMAFRKENRDNKFLTEQQQQQQRNADFAAARSRIDTHARDMLNSGEITDKETQNKIRNLIAGKTIVMGSGFNETAQQEYLDKYNAELAKILSEVPPPKPQPTAQELHDQGVVVEEGVRGQRNAKGEFVPFQQPKPSKEQEQEQQKIEAMRPKSFQDYYGENEDKFQKDLDATMQSMEKTDPKTGVVTPATQDEALAKMQKDYDFRQKALGRSQYGEPTPAGPADPGAAATPASPGTERSILEPSQAPALPGAAPASPGEPSSILDAPIPSQQEGLRAEYDAEMTAKGYKLITPPDGGRPYYYHEGSNTQADTGNQWSDMASGRRTYDPPYREVPPPASQPEVPSQPTAAQPAGSPKPSAPITPPDFGKLSEGASESDLEELNSMKEVYNKLPPNAQQAMNVILSDSATKEQKAAANRALLQMGINLQDELSKRAVKPEYPNFAETNAVM